MSPLRRLVVPCLLALGLLLPVAARAGVSEVSTKLKPAPQSKQDAAKPSTAQPAKPAEVAKDKAAEEKEPVLPGIPQQRPNGTWLSLRVEGGVWMLSFYDAKKKPAAADFARGSVRWKPQQKTGNATCVLSPGGDGSSLVGNIPVLPPRIFKVFVTLTDAAGEPVESYVFDYRDPQS